MIQMYLVTAYLLVYSHLTQNNLHSASYTIIISVLLLRCYYIYVARVLPTTTKPDYYSRTTTIPTTTAMVSLPARLSYSRRIPSSARISSSRRIQK